ncbi:hypothetical protein IWQ55_002740 [Labrenzia sp. EL_208]|nr:hypothetical protein [Labrenzia sp. EL_132]MBG6229527.1 hypothetical protein [Labrenzia sp. EL_208]
MSAKHNLDVSLVCGARPNLLKETLQSFSTRLFKNFQINTCFVNLDPFEGGPKEVAACEEICREYFPKIVARKPETPHFTSAVKWLWSQAQADWCFHMEDDWTLNREVRTEEFEAAQKRRVAQITLMTSEKNWGYRSQYHYEPSRLLILGGDIGKSLNKKRPIFTTSPSFVQRTFANRCSELMDETLDPEKQLNYMNPPLNAFTAKYRNRFIGARREYVAVDIGRRHRDNQGIIKTITAGNSVWVKQDDT